MREIYFLLACLLLWIPACYSKFKSVVQCPEQPSLLNGEVDVDVYNRLRKFKCNKGYKMLGEAKQECGEDGHWQPPTGPTCVLATGITGRTRCKVPHFQNAKVQYDTWNPLDQAEKATVICDPGYTTSDPNYKESFLIVCNAVGLWTMEDGVTLPLQCPVKRCPIPPSVPHALYHYGSVMPMMGEGSLIIYTCKRGYEFVDANASNMTCHLGQWIGDVPRCVEVQTCNAPPSIPDGNYDRELDTRNMYPGSYNIGSKVIYNCRPGFKLVGSKTLECLSKKQWSSIPPQCVPIGDSTFYHECMCEENGVSLMSLCRDGEQLGPCGDPACDLIEPSFYCHDVGDVSNGQCKCHQESDLDLQLCQPFYRDVQIECFCNDGYRMEGAPLLTCIQSNSLIIGTWDHDKPYCVAVEASDVGTVAGDTYSTGDIMDARNHVSTLVIVIATACSVLGVLLLIMVIVVFRRRKPRPHLFHPGATPLPYSRVHSNSIDEQDRLALMAYADATRVHLPTYEEATTGQCRSNVIHPPPQPLTNPTTEFRPLPSIPPTLRTNATIGGESSNRHSTVTTSTINRDGTSEIFGSLDTVNVSMSDASTSVTVETYDSGTSMRSIASQEATAGSFTASDDNLANDDAPLLDNTGENQSDSSSDSLPSQERKEE